MDDLYRGYFDEPEPEEVADLLASLREAITRSPFEVGPCGICNKPTIYLADGMAPLCEPCAKAMEAEQ